MTHASLFSGIGGPEVAAAMLGWENLFHCEINPFGRKVLEYWFPNSVSYEDITKTSFKEWRGKVDVLTGGFPCQPFSYAGKRGGAEDARYLWPEMLRAIDEIRPAWVVGENVAGLATMVEGWLPTEVGRGASLFEEGTDVHDCVVEQTYTIERIAGELEGLGYSVQPVLVPAAACGAPHRRDRIFILASYADTDRRDDVRGAGEDAGKSKSERLQERHEVRKPGESSELRPEIPGAATHADGERRDEYDPAALSGTAGRFHREADPLRGNGGLFPGRRWADFPTQPPVHRGNDGLPFNVDDLSISFGKWRTESLKAYGNAIVPQVMYRIFEAIEKVSLTPNTTKK